VREPAVTRQATHDEEIEVIQRGGPEGDPNVARSEGGIRLGNVSYLYLIEAAGGADDAGGMKAGVIICSAPVVGNGTAAPPVPIGWM